jgi:protein-S-isoprenylcysteine O-methyltransferase Ste14
MTNGQPGTAGDPNRAAHWPTALASLAVGAVFLALWFWLLPPWLGFQVDIFGVARWRWIAAIPSVLCFAVALRCIWDFGWTGHGTPVPIAPPQRLVAVGFYRHVRNPMYLGFFVGWLGLWVIFGRANLAAITVAFVAVVGIAFFVRLYEEPTLRKMFRSGLRRILQERSALDPANRRMAPVTRSSANTVVMSYLRVKCVSLTWVV